MVLLDVNVIVALAWPHHVHHQRAVDWFAMSNDPWSTTPLTEVALMRLSLSPAVAPVRPSVPEVLALLAAFQAHARHRFLPDVASLADPAIDLSRAASSGQVTDLHLVNLAAASGAVLATFDRRIPSFLVERDRRHVVVLP
jgi:hypothetical protein